MRVLAAEDAESMRELISLYLTKAGHELDLACDGGEAVERYKAASYELVILDMQMPVLDGPAAARAIRAYERESGRAPAPILALTGSAEPAAVKLCLDAGCTSALAKPFTRESLLDAVAPAPAGVVKADPDFADLIPRFLDNCRVEDAEMRRALARQDYAALAATGHRLIGAGTSYGFAGITAAARLVETAAERRDPAGVSRGLEALASYLASVKVSYER